MVSSVTFQIVGQASRLSPSPIPVGQASRLSLSPIPVGQASRLSPFSVLFPFWLLALGICCFTAPLAQCATNVYPLRIIAGGSTNYADTIDFGPAASLVITQFTTGPRHAIVGGIGGQPTIGGLLAWSNGVLVLYTNGWTIGGSGGGGITGTNNYLVGGSSTNLTAFGLFARNSTVSNSYLVASTASNLTSVVPLLVGGNWTNAPGVDGELMTRTAGYLSAIAGFLLQSDGGTGWKITDPTAPWDTWIHFDGTAGQNFWDFRHGMMIPTLDGVALATVNSTVANSGSATYAVHAGGWDGSNTTKVASAKLADVATTANTATLANTATTALALATNAISADAALQLWFGFSMRDDLADGTWDNMVGMFARNYTNFSAFGYSPLQTQAVNAAMRDQSLMIDSNGNYWVAADWPGANGWDVGQTNNFCILQSNDLLTWKYVTTVWCSNAVPIGTNVIHVWAPEWVSPTNIFVAIGTNGQSTAWEIWETHATDLSRTTWTPLTHVTTDLPGQKLDPFVFQNGLTNELWVASSSYLTYGTSLSLNTFSFLHPTGLDWAGFGASEGASMLRRPDGSRILFMDDYTRGGMLYSISTNGSAEGPWTTPALLASPMPMRHGTVVDTHGSIKPWADVGRAVASQQRDGSEIKRGTLALTPRATSTSTVFQVKLEGDSYPTMSVSKNSTAFSNSVNIASNATVGMNLIVGGGATVAGPQTNTGDLVVNGAITGNASGLTNLPPSGQPFRFPVLLPRGTAAGLYNGATMTFNALNGGPTNLFGPAFAVAGVNKTLWWDFPMVKTVGTNLTVTAKIFSSAADTIQFHIQTYSLTNLSASGSTDVSSQSFAVANFVTNSISLPTGTNVTVLPCTFGVCTQGLYQLNFIIETNVSANTWYLIDLIGQFSP